MRSALQNPSVVSEYLMAECAAGRVIGPFGQHMFPPGSIQINKFGVIPKGTPGKWRLIVDLSAPEGSSVNDGVDTKLCSLQYVKVEDAAQEVAIQGFNAWMAKVDIQQAYRNVPIHPQDRWLLGMLWEGRIFIDTIMPFGLRSAPKIFTALADAVEWVLQQRGVRFVIHYLDDFFLVGGTEYAACALQLKIILDTFQELGLPIALNKLEGPSTRLTFLGFELDSRAMVVRLPQSKIQELQSEIMVWKRKDSCLKKEMDSLVGKLSHAAKVVRPGKTFLRNLYQKLAETEQPYHHIRFNIPVKSDLMWWAMFIQSWNGVSMLREYSSQQSDFEAWTDASGSFGCGAIWGKRWLQASWSDVYKGDLKVEEEDGITLKELLPIILACAIWGPHWRQSSALIHCDNEGTVAVVNSGYSRVEKIMHLLRCLFFIRARFGIEIKAVHVPGKENLLADAISRNNISSLLSQIPEAATTQETIPQNLINLSMRQQPDWTSAAWSQLFTSCFRQD